MGETEVEAISRLNSLVRSMIPPEREQEFDTGSWLAWWLDTYAPALGARPRDLLNDVNGEQMVADCLMRVQSGAYM